MRPFRCAHVCTSLLITVLATADPTFAQDRSQPDSADTSRERFVRNMLYETRSFLRDGRIDSAELAARRGLAAAPDDARLHAALARVLTARGLDDEATLHRRRANELAPPPPPLPGEPLLRGTPGVIIVLVPPPIDADRPDRIPADWPDGSVAGALERRLALRLPSAAVEFANPRDISEAREWLRERDPRGVVSLRVERSYCADTVKDGFFAVARLRTVAAIAGSAGGPRDPEVRNEVVHDPGVAEGCAAEALGRVLERTFASPAVQHALRAPELARGTPEDRYSTPSIRALFPEIGERIEATLTHGRMQLAMGRVAAAAATFRKASSIDPEDPAVIAYIAEADATIAMANELADAHGEKPAHTGELGVLDPRLSAAQRAAAQARLAVAQQRRADLLVARDVLDVSAQAPTAETLAALRSGNIIHPNSFGQTKALERAPGGIEVRVAFAPDGSEIARYYLARDGADALLREEDADGNGAPDRWTSYVNGNRSEIWENGRGGGNPDLHFVYSADGLGVDRVELDTNGDGRIDRIFDYTAGDLRSESRDTDDDGILDRFVRFDAEGRVESRDEDLDGDGQIDRSATYRAGRLLERSFREPIFDPGDT